MSTPVEQIKERLSIVDVVGSYLKLERAGSNLKARCPFHQEKTPSFFVSPARGTFYCFGCGKKGDIFSFVQEFEGLDFVGALRVLASRAGIELKKIDPEMRSIYARLYLIVEKATRFFERELSKRADVASYLTGRGLTEATIHSWRIGFAPNEWRVLHDYLVGEGFAPEEIEKTGLIKRSTKNEGGEGRWYDAFRGRIMFPLADSANRIIAFSGRILPALDDGKTGKYINSPETALFHKSEVLYGFSRAKFAIREKDAAILVEGQMDLLMAHQAGYTNAVAVSGTALTPRHLERLKRLTENLLFSFDADAAGVRASERAIALALRQGFNMRVIALADKDPADLIAKQPEQWREAVVGAKHVIEFLLEAIEQGEGDARAKVHAVETKLLPFITYLKSPLEQSHFVKFIAEHMGLREEILWEAFKKIPRAHESVPAEAAPLSRKMNTPERVAILILLYLRTKPEWKAESERVSKALATVWGEGWEKRINTLEKEKELLLHEAEVRFDNQLPHGREIDEVLLSVEEEMLTSTFAALLERLSRAERGKGSEEMPALLAECKQVSGRLAELKASRFT